MSGFPNSGMYNSNSSRTDSSGRPLNTSFSAQPGASGAVFNNAGNIPGLQGAHGSYNMPGSFASRNATMIGASASGVQQVAGNEFNGRFGMNNLPTSLSQISFGSIHGRSGIPNNGGSGVSQNLGSIGRIPNSMFSHASGGNIGRGLGPAGGSNLSGGPNMASVAPRLNLTAPQIVSMLGDTYTAAAVALAQNQYQSGNGHGPSMALLNEMNAHENPAFDMYEFPQPSGLPNPAGGSQGQLGYRRQQNVGFNQQSQGYEIQNDDFPVLPGYRGGNSEYQGNMCGKEPVHESMPSMMRSQHLSRGRSAGYNIGSTSTSNQLQQQQLSSSRDGSELSYQPASYQDLHFHGPEGRGTGISMLGAGTSNSSHQAPGVATYDQATQQYQQLQNHTRSRMVSSLRDQAMTSMHTSQAPIRDQDVTSRQTSQAVPDRFGMLGLLDVISMTNPDLTSLALGEDLTALGLDLNSTENLHKTFASPWSDEPAKEEPKYSIPECYNSRLPPPPKQARYAKFRLTTLFYIFYSMPKDEAQLYAANELHNRGWFYNKDLHLWMSRETEPLVKSSAHERGSYYSFDPNTWRITIKENFVLQYEMVEKRPAIPLV